MDSLVVNSGFTVKVDPLNGSPTGFAPSATNKIYDWVIGYSKSSNPLSFSGVTLNTSQFTGANVQPYHFSLITVDDDRGGQDIVLHYSYDAVPEATTLLLGAMGVMPLLLQRRTRRLDVAARANADGHLQETL